MIRNIRRTSWIKYVSELEQRLYELNRVPVNILSIDDIQALASTLQSEILKSYNLACPMRKIKRKTENIWWNTELACLRREDRKAQRKAIKYKLENDWKAFKQAQLCFKNAIRKAKRDSWCLFTKSMNSHCATARLAKLMHRNKTMRVSNVLRPNGEYTKSIAETIKCLLDTLAPGNRKVRCNHAADETDENIEITLDDQIVNFICSLEKME